MRGFVVLQLIGCLVASAGVFLPWLRVQATFTETGLAFLDGRIALGVAAVGASAAAYGLISQRTARLSWVLAATAAVLFMIGGTDLTDLRRLATTLSDSHGAGAVVGAGVHVTLSGATLIATGCLGTFVLRRWRNRQALSDRKGSL